MISPVSSLSKYPTPRRSALILPLKRDNSPCPIGDKDEVPRTSTKIIDLVFALLYALFFLDILYS